MKRLLLIFLITVTVILLLGSLDFNGSPGSGEKIGQIVKVAKVGIFFRTWEAELIRGGLSSGSGTVGTVPFDFTIESDAMAQEALRFMRDQTEVLVVYRTEVVYMAGSSGSGGNFAQSITPKKELTQGGLTEEGHALVEREIKRSLESTK